MIDRSVRHRGFARRLLTVMGLSSLAAVALTGAACGGKVVVDITAGGGGGSGGTTGAGGAGGAFVCDSGGVSVSLVCLPSQGAACPALTATGLDQQLAAQLGVCDAVFDVNSCCGLTGLTWIACGPAASAAGCCYYGHVEDSILCGLGRPFLVEGVARTAPARPRGDWSASEGPALAGVAALDPVTRAALAAGWTRDGGLEHASVGSFARLALELLAVGAPAALLRDAQRALGDEIRHAELCFALASAYAGAPVGPGPFAIEGALARTSLEAVAAAAVREGCIGETVAALVAEEARDAAEDPAARAALTVIAADEAEHAAMAWRLVAWAYRAGGAEVQEAIAAAFAAPVDAAEEALPAGVDERVYRAHGRPLPGDVRAVMEAALADVIRPSAAALMGSVAAA